MRKLRWADIAKDDLVGIADYYDRISPELRRSIVAKITNVPTLLRERPLMGPPIGLHELRKWSVKGAPFILLYRIAPGEIEIARVHHAAQDWQAE